MTTSPQGASKLEGVHPHLVKVILGVAVESPQPFVILEGPRTVERQRQLVAKGASRTMKSRHIPAANGLSHAVDIAPLVNGAASWDWAYYYKLAPIVKRVAAVFGVPLEWGGDWKSFKDGPHWQLPWASYPGTSQLEDLVLATGPLTAIPEEDDLGYPTLHKGAFGPDVYSLQAALNGAGAAPRLKVDGGFGPATKTAVVAFQKSRRLVADGIVGPKTWAALLPYRNSKVTS